MNWELIAIVAMPIVTIAGMVLTVRRANTQQSQDLKLELTQLRERVEHVDEQLEKHEERCKDRWEQNWAEHRDHNTRIATMEGQRAQGTTQKE